MTENLAERLDVGRLETEALEKFLEPSQWKEAHGQAGPDFPEFQRRVVEGTIRVYQDDDGFHLRFQLDDFYQGGSGQQGTAAVYGDSDAAKVGAFAYYRALLVLRRLEEKDDDPSSR